MITSPRFCSLHDKYTAERIRLFAIHQLKQRENERKLNAARRALSAANKLKNPEQKKLHKSRIFSAMNKLRAA